MNEELLNTLKPSEKIDWQEHPARSVLLSVWTFTKWITLGFLVISGWVIWLIVSIVFSEALEKKGGL